MRLRRLEAVLVRRTTRFTLVLDGLVDEFNVSAVLRTAESLGVQHVWIVAHVPQAGTDGGRKNGKVASSVHRGALRYLTVRRFDSPEECIAAARERGLRIWATDLSPCAVVLDAEHCPPETMAEPLAIVMGREAAGVRPQFFEACERRVYLPMAGFTESFNISVATALCLQRLFDLCPDARGDMSEEERAELRELWVSRLGRSKASLASMRAALESGPVEPVPDLRKDPSKKGVFKSRLQRRAEGKARTEALLAKQRRGKLERIARREAALAAGAKAVADAEAEAERKADKE